MKPPRLNFSCWLSIFCISAGAHAAALPPAVVTALASAGVPQRSVAVVVQRVDSSQALLSHNPKQAMIPASVMKLVTTYAGLELLGPAYTWSTEVLVDALPTGGKLDGNLYLRGSGDPRLALEQFWLLLRQLRARGIGEISGELIIDRSAFSLPPHDPAEFDSEPLRPYNAGPDALMVNFKSVHLTLQPDAAEKTVRIVAETPSEGLRISNRLALAGDACGDWRERLKITVGDEVIEIGGSLAAACGDKALHLSPWPADVQVERLFRALWRELGGTLGGRVRDGSTPAKARLFATHRSPPLAEIVRDINKFSNNVMARQLFLSLSGERPATAEAARRRLGAWLAGKKLSLPEMVIDNGSGLSRRERISADGLAQILLAAWQSPVMPELLASLPIAGSDGTLKKRFGESAASGRAHLKTGYIDGTRAIAGYVLDRSGKRWVVTCLINDPRASAALPAMDALINWVAEH